MGFLSGFFWVALCLDWASWWCVSGVEAAACSFLDDFPDRFSSAQSDRMRELGSGQEGGSYGLRWCRDGLEGHLSSLGGDSALAPKLGSESSQGRYPFSREGVHAAVAGEWFLKSAFRKGP